MNDFWLQCIISQGLFPNECAVSTNTAEGDTVTFFADKAFIQSPDREGPNSILVRAATSGANRYHVILPADPFESSRNIIVNSEQITGSVS